MAQTCLTELAGRRTQICNEIAAIKTMRRGSFNEFYNNEKRKDGSVVKRGPFYSITSGGLKGKTTTVSVPKGEAERVKAEVDNYRKFRELTDEYVTVCEKLSLLENSDDEAKKN